MLTGVLVLHDAKPPRVRARTEKPAVPPVVLPEKPRRTGLLRAVLGRLNAWVDKRSSGEPTPAYRQGR